MKVYTSNRYPRLRERFSNSAKIARIINRCDDTVIRKMNKGAFTSQEQSLILEYLGLEDNETNRKELFTP